MIYLAGLIVSMLVTAVLIPPVIALANRMGLVDVPNQRKVHVKPIPRIGGLAMVVGSAIPLMIWLQVDPHLVGYFAGAFIIILFGVLDDRYDLNFKIKFAAQVVAALSVAWLGGIQISTISLAGHLIEIPQLLSIGLTVFFILAVTNAVNFADGLDGLAGGVVLLSLFVLTFVATQVGAYDIVLVSIVLIGSIFGFLLFNSHPAQIFMGDTGSQYLGFSLAALTIYLTQVKTHIYSSFLPLLIIGLPLVDLASVIVTRMFSRRSVFKPDKSHIHHRLLSFGLDQYGSVFVIYLLQTLIVTCAIIFRFESDPVVFLIFIFFISLIGGAMLFVWHRRGMFDFKGVNHLFRAPLRFFKHTIKDFNLPKWASIAALMLILSYLLVGILFLHQVTFWLGIVVVVLMLVLLAIQKTAFNSPLYEWLVRFSYYLGVLGIAYLVFNQPLFYDTYKAYLDIFFIVLALLTFIGIQYSDNQSLSIRPTDFLVLVATLTLPVIGSVSSTAWVWGSFAIYILVLFYATELVLAAFKRSKGKMKFAKYLYVLPMSLLAIRGVIGF